MFLSSVVVIVLLIIAVTAAQPSEPQQFRFLLQFLENAVSDIDDMRVSLGSSYDQLRAHFERLRREYDEPIRLSVAQELRLVADLIEGHDDAHDDDRLGAGPIRAARYMNVVEGDPRECAICMDPVETAATSCPHSDQNCFHLHCAERSLRTTSCRNRCPICRQIWIYCQ